MEKLQAKVREWDSNGTVFGFNPSIPGHDAGRLVDRPSFFSRFWQQTYV